MKNLFIFIILLYINTVYSQPTGEIDGKVIDKFSQQPVEGAVVEIQSLEIKTGTDIDGKFNIIKIPVGTYSVKVSSLGYIPLIIDNIIVDVNRPVNILAEIELNETAEIIVEAERFLKPADISNSIKNLQYEEIRRSPGGFEDIGRVIQTLPGVSFVNDGRNDLIVRGGSPSENLFLVDNSTVPNINHFGSQGSTGGPLSIINLNFVREVNFLTGGFSARYGDKLSSVLEVKLREGNRKKLMTDINLSATGFGATVESPLDKKQKSSFLLSTRRSYLDLIFNAAGFGFVPEYSDFQLKVTYDINSRNFLTINGIGNIDKVKFNNDTKENIQNNENILQNNQWGYVNSIEWKSLLTSKSYALLNLTRNYTDFDIYGRDSLFREKFSNKSKEGETTLKAEYFSQYFNSGLHVNAGAGFRLINFKYDIFNRQDTLLIIDPSTGNNIIIPGVQFNTDKYTYKGFGYLQMSFHFIKSLIINAGIRYDFFDFINKKHYIAPRFSASYSFSRKFSLNFSYGIFYQSPSYVWLVANPLNTYLNNIKAEHYVAGIEFLPATDIKITLEGYRKNYSDYPVSSIRPYFILANSGGDFQRNQDFGLEPLISAGKGYANGIELFVQKALTEKLYGTFNLSVFTAKYTSLDGIERESDYNNRILFTVNGGYKFGAGWEIASKFRFAGGRPYTPINETNGLQDISLYNSTHLPNFYSLDVRVDKRWNFRKWSLITYIDILNVTNRKNITSYRWNKYDQKVEANKTIGILPSIGINAMF